MPRLRVLALDYQGNHEKERLDALVASMMAMAGAMG